MNVIFGTSGFISISLQDFCKKNYLLVDRNNNVYYEGNKVSDDSEKYLRDILIDTIFFLSNGLNYSSDFISFKNYNTFEQSKVNLIFSKLNFNCFVYFSSGGSIYYDSSISTEQSNLKPNNFYSLNKINVEYLLHLLSEKYNKRYVSLRITNPYGLKQITHSNNGVISRVIKSLFNKDKFLIYSNPSLKKNYIYIDDLLILIFNIIKSNHFGPINVGSPHYLSIFEIIKKVENYFCKSLDYDIVDYDKNIVQSHNLDFSLLNSISPKEYISFEDSLEHYNIYFKDV